MAAEPVILWLTEHKTLATDQLNSTQIEHLRQDFGEVLTVQRSWEPGKIDLTAGNHIGTIVGDGLRIHIRPKTPLTNLFFMLTYAYELAKFRDGQSPLVSSDDLFEFLLEIFVKQIDQLVRQGIYRGYIDYEENQPYLRGRLLLAEQLQRNAVQLTRFQQRTNELTADLRENRILKFTLWQLSRMNFDNKELRRRLRRTLSAFSEVSLTAVGPAECDTVIYNRLNGLYQTPINLARLFLQHLSLEGRKGETSFNTYLLPMHQIFELFVARFLDEHFRPDPTFSIDIQPRVFLDVAHQEKGYPDIVLNRNGQPFMILDTKYKLFGGSPKKEDRNQMFMYSHAMAVQQALLIYSDSQDFHYEGHFKGMTLAARPLALDGELADFKDRCHRFADSLASDLVALEKVEAVF